MPRLQNCLIAALLLAFLGLGYAVLEQRTIIVHIGQVRTNAGRIERDRVGDLQRQLTAARVARAEAEKQIARLQDGQTAAAPPERTDARTKMITLHTSDIARDHPEYAAIVAWQNRRGTLQQLGPGLAKLNLPPEQLAKLKDLLVERQASANDAQQAAVAAGMPPGSPGWQDAVKQAQAGVDQEITSVVGTDGSKFVNQLQLQANFTNTVQNSFAPDFEDAGVALSPDQTSALARAMADANYSGKDISLRPPNYNNVDPETQLSPHDDRILAAAAQSLTPAQVDILKADMIQARQKSAILRQYTTGATAGYQIVP